MLTATTQCLEHADLFRHPLLEDAPANLSPAMRHAQAMLFTQAAGLCAACPARRQCLYDAVVRYDVAGVVAGTTPAMRAAIRGRLGWRVNPENFDALLGLNPGGHVDHEQVLRARRTNPDESLDQLAERLGCSLSTIKRHLRQERGGHPHLHVVPPSSEQVLQALRDVQVERRSHERLLQAA